MSHVARTQEGLDELARLEIDALIAMGGDGSRDIAHKLGQKGLKLVGVPKTIDNDLAATNLTFGFTTAVETATDAIGCGRLQKGPLMGGVRSQRRPVSVTKKRITRPLTGGPPIEGSRVTV